MYRAEGPRDDPVTCPYPGKNTPHANEDAQEATEGEKPSSGCYEYRYEWTSTGKEKKEREPHICDSLMFFGSGARI